LLRAQGCTRLLDCIEHAAGGIDAAAESLRKELPVKRGAVIRSSLAIPQRRFADDTSLEGHCKDGPVSVAKFELNENDGAAEREAARALRQCEVSALIQQLLLGIDELPHPASCCSIAAS
jgi:hypothetical protein